MRQVSLKVYARGLRRAEFVPLLPEEQASALGRNSDTPISKTEVVEQADVMLVLGGDGTLLSTAHTPKIEKVPILAINIGTLGFLTDASLDELYPTLESLLTGDYRIEHRMMLEVVVNSQIQMNTDSQNPEVIYYKPNQRAGLERRGGSFLPNPSNRTARNIKKAISGFRAQRCCYSALHAPHRIGRVY